MGCTCTGWIENDWDDRGELDQKEHNSSEINYMYIMRVELNNVNNEIKFMKKI